ncbi:IS200/IS605-like element ISAs26 family transposase, partial [Aeromonas caviae]|nr:IS200/IS605-like element ISAs26 family transposase [Aeromonas caviae]
MQFTKINKSRHAAYVLHVHLVFITKYRKPILGDLHHASFGQCAAEVCRDFGAELK